MTAAKKTNARALPSRSRQDAARPGPASVGMALYAGDGAQLYLTSGERTAFLKGVLLLKGT